MRASAAHTSAACLACQPLPKELTPLFISKLPHVSPNTQLQQYQVAVYLAQSTNMACSWVSIATVLHREEDIVNMHFASLLCDSILAFAELLPVSVPRCCWQ